MISQRTLSKSLQGFKSLTSNSAGVLLWFRSSDKGLNHLFLQSMLHKAFVWKGMLCATLSNSKELQVCAL